MALPLILILLAVPPLWRELFRSLGAAIQSRETGADCWSRIDARLLLG